MKEHLVTIAVILVAMLVWDILDRLFLGAMLDGLLSYEMSV